MIAGFILGAGFAWIIIDILNDDFGCSDENDVNSEHYFH